MEAGISPNIQRHFDYLVPQIKKLESRGMPAIHFFLMADTEVDLLPFLNKLRIDEIEFTRRCQESINLISTKVIESYGKVRYTKEGLPPAARFLDFFGVNSWYERYEYFKSRLIREAEDNHGGRIAISLDYDYRGRNILIRKLLGNVSKQEGTTHIARQRAQYMAFASLMREKFGNRLVVANHRTPNFAWMNDKLTREPKDPEQLSKGNYLSKIPLIELDIDTLPGK